ncbi:hypothetical protein [Rhizobium laguerreae]|uniref:hypothetical protein n=1 Tax=Rhizobium laguerreae TaxID=1076926 RepID=UPI001C8FE810|nr:hypothetical protein [Rhizobium laguerreae]MBY3483453.1 hypothetical protein [Rhizobium laguerreae]
MNLTSGFVSELVRAANQIALLSISEVRLLLQRSIATIRDLRQAVGIPVDGTANDALIRLELASEGVERLSHENQAEALLEAADLIRTLGIVLESGTQVSVRPVD